MKILSTIIGLLAITSCSHMNNADPQDSADVFRRLTWIEGSLQTDYLPNADIVERKLARWQGKTPDMKNTEEYLRYLSVLAASSEKKLAASKIKGYLERFPEENRAVFLLGVYHLRSDNRNIAKHLFSKLERDSSFKWRSLLLNNLGMIALQERLRDTALGYFEKATKASPRIAAPLVNLGAIYLEGRSYPQAEKVFRAAVSLDDKFEDAVLGLGAALEGSGKFSQANQVYEKYANSHPRALSVLYNNSILLGNRLNRQKDASEIMLRYIQGGGKETVRAHKLLQTWR